MIKKAWANGSLTLTLVLAALISPLFLHGQPAELLRRPENFERSRDYDALHYKLVFVLDDKEKSYRGENMITLASLKDGLKSLVFDAEDFAVTEVTWPAGRALPFALENKKLAVNLTRGLAYGETVSIVVRFYQKNPKTGLKFIGEAPDHPGQINTYSWPEEAHHWFPGYDYPNDKVTSEVIATVRGDFKVLSNGRLVGVTEDKAAGTKTWHWSQEKPHPAYCIMLAAGPFEVIEDSLGSLPVDYWVYPKDAADARRSFHKTPKMIDFYNKTFGLAYPWAKYDQVCVAGYGGGMEATTATILGQGTIHDERADQDFSSDGLVAHELAHMWWGDLVTERAWPDVWLSESFATYSEYLFSRSDRGEDEGALNLEDKKAEYLNEARSRYIRPIVFNRYNQPWEIMDGHSYPKGAAVLHMLRFVMGDKPFFRMIGDFLSRFAFKNADTHDLMTVVKESSGENLDWFFEQWIYKPGHPVFEVSTAWDGNTGKLRVKIRQVQDFSKGIPVYKTPVLIGIRTPGKSAAEKVWISRKEETFEFDAPERPLLVSFDEGNYLLKELTFEKSMEELVFQLRNDDAVGRLRAAADLAPYSGDAAVRDVLLEAAGKDGFWAVRRAAVETLAKSGGSGLELFLKEKLSDGNSRVRAAAIRALGRAKSPSLVPFFESTFKRDSSYLVQAESLAAIGECGGRDRIAFLKKAGAMASPWNILHRSADSAIKKIGAENPKVLIKTEAGEIVVEIYASKAPATAANFLRYIDAGLYDGTTFFRNVTLGNQPANKVKIEVIQGGQVDEAREFPAIVHETTRETGLKHVDAAFSMARSNPGSATSSFFICINDQPELDYGGRRNPDGQGFAAFGKVVSGLDIVRKIHGLPTQGQQLHPPVKIISIRRIGQS
jgi:aminopeptidase N